MREIKFRGKDIKTEGWVYGFYVHFQDFGRKREAHRISSGVSDSMPEGDGYDFCAGFWDVDPDTVGQFTGLTDKNGKEIYEGDIVECVSWNEYFSKDGKPMGPFRRKMYVDFRKGGFKMVEPMPEPWKDNEWDIIYNGDIEVIGNVHDNPDLVKF